jgi:S-adenosyl methyltransferase
VKRQRAPTSMSQPPRTIHQMDPRPTRPTTARVDNYLLGGKDNYAADRTAAQAMKRAASGFARTARENRRFLGRAVTHLGEIGIRQFLDIGCGLPAPALPNVHQLAQAATPYARVVYADHDPHVLTHARALLATDEATTVIEADLREPHTILKDPGLTALLDLGEPVAVLLTAVLHYLPDEADPAAAITELCAGLAPGSYLVASHVVDHPATRAIQALMQTSGAPPWYPRTRPDITRILGDLHLLSPGVTAVDQWHPGTPLPGVAPLTTAGEPSWYDGAVAVLLPSNEQGG